MNQIDFKKAGLERCVDQDFKDDGNEVACYQLTLKDGVPIKVTNYIEKNKRYLYFDFRWIINHGEDFAKYNLEYGKLYFELMALANKYNGWKNPNTEDIINLIEKINDAYIKVKNFKKDPITVYKFGGYYFTLYYCQSEYDDKRKTVIWKKTEALNWLSDSERYNLNEANLLNVIELTTGKDDLGDLRDENKALRKTLQEQNEIILRAKDWLNKI